MDVFIALKVAYSGSDFYQCLSVFVADFEALACQVTQNFIRYRNADVYIVSES
jgi:hypothetical protein